MKLIDQSIDGVYGHRYTGLVLFGVALVTGAEGRKIREKETKTNKYINNVVVHICF